VVQKTQRNPYPVPLNQNNGSIEAAIRLSYNQVDNSIHNRNLIRQLMLWLQGLEVRHQQPFEEQVVQLRQSLARLRFCCRQFHLFGQFDAVLDSHHSRV
jgi:hypothetical protein